MGLFDSLINPAAVGGAFEQGMRAGRSDREEREVRGALSAYAVNPDDKSAFEKLAQYRPELAIQIGQQRQKAQQAQQEQRRADLPLMGRLLDGITDEATYQQRKALAGQYGIDTSQLPQTFDPAWVEQQKQTVQLLSDPVKAEALSAAGKQAADEGLRPGSPEYGARVREIWNADQVKTIPYTQGGGVAGYNTATGEAQTIIAPNPGGYAAGTPVASGGGGVPEGATATHPQTGEKIIFRNGQWKSAGQGGGGQRVTSNFLDGL